MKYLDGHSMASISREIGVNENTIILLQAKRDSVGKR
jgi:hypothetical protein